MLAEMEAEVTYSEPSPFYAIENLQEWALYLRLRTMPVFGGCRIIGTPNPQFGNWEEIPLPTRG
jgi:hypothetical protein